MTATFFDVLFIAAPSEFCVAAAVAPGFVLLPICKSAAVELRYVCPHLIARRHPPVNTLIASETAPRTALIMGAGDSLGAALARRFAREGMTVCIARRNAEQLQPLVEEIRE